MMSRCRRQVLPVLLLTASLLGGHLLLSTPCAAQEGLGFRVIVHPDNPLATLSIDDVSRLLLRRDTAWPDGVEVDPVDLRSGSDVREKLSQAIHGRGTSKIESYWQRRLFAGEAVPPQQLRDEDEMLVYVREHRGAIGYISDTVEPVGVREIRLLTPPEPIERVEASYNAVAQRRRIQGIVRLLVQVDAEGEVSDVEVVEGLPGGLSIEAVHAVRKWRFRPARIGNQAVAGEVEVAINFRLLD